MSADAATQFLRFIRANFVTFEDFRIVAFASRNWASATFAGFRHEVTFRVAGAGAGAAVDAFLDGIEEREADLRGYFLADVALVARDDRADGVRVSLEALALVAD